jgi:tetratricopeptide (TPR) repeat protein
MKSLWTVLVVALTLGTVAPVSAQKIVCPAPSKDLEANKKEGRRYYNMGNTFFNMGQYAKSASSFACVLHLVPYSVMARYQLAVSYQKLGVFSLAREHYQWVIADTSAEARPLHGEASAQLAALRGKPDKRVAGSTRPEDPSLDGGTPAADGWNLKSRWWFWTGVGAVSLFACTALFTGWQALEYRDRWETDWKDNDRDSLNHYKDMTDLALGGVVLSAAALGYALWLNRPGRPAGVQPATAPSGASNLLVLPTCGPGGCLLTLSLEF